MPPPLIPGYQLLRPLSEGRGAGWQARSARGDVLVKLYPAKGEDVTSFASRAGAMSALDDPHFAHVVDRGQSGEFLFVAREYFSTDSLSTRVEGMNLEQKLRLSVNLGRALERAHRRGLSHGAIKPENVLFRTLEQPALSDFSFAGPPRPSPFAAPEQSGFYRLDPAVDQYSLAMLVAWMLLGRTPEPAETISKDDALNRALQQALTLHSAGRFQRLDELLTVLETSLRQSGAPPGRAPFELRVEHVANAIRVHISGIWTPESVDTCITEVSRALDAPGEHALGYLLDAESGCHSTAIEALAAMHSRYRGRLKRVGFVSGTPQARGMSVLIGQRVAGLPWKTFASADSMESWLGEASV